MFTYHLWPLSWPLHFYPIKRDCQVRSVIELTLKTIVWVSAVLESLQILHLAVSTNLLFAFSCLFCCPPWELATRVVYVNCLGWRLRWAAHFEHQIVSVHSIVEQIIKPTWIFYSSLGIMRRPKFNALLSRPRYWLAIGFDHRMF